MSDYHYDDDDEEFGSTIRLDQIQDEVKNREEKGNSDPEDTKLETLLLQEKEKELLQKSAGSYVPEEVNKNTPPVGDKNTKKEQPLTPTAGGASSGGALHRGGKKQYQLLMALAMIAGLVVIIGTSALLFASLNKQEPPEQSGADEGPALDVGKKQEFLALVKNVNSSRDISFYDIDNDKDDSLRAEADIVVSDESGGKRQFTDIQIGDVLQMAFSGGELVESIVYPKDVWEREEVTGFHIDTENKTITVGEEKFSFHGQTVALYQDKLIDIANLDPTDVVLLRGYDKDVWAVEVQQYHGFIVIKNKEEIVNGMLTVDGRGGIAIGDKDRIAATSGVHDIVVSGDNILPYKKKIYVPSGEDFEVDLSGAQSKTCVVILESNVENYSLEVDGKPADTASEAFVLPFGEYKISATKQGYQPFELSVVLSEETYTLNLSLQPLEGRITFQSQPVKTSIYIDGTYQGVTPLTVSMEYGEHELLAKASDYEEFSTTLTIEKPEDELSVVLIPKK